MFRESIVYIVKNLILPLKKLYRFSVSENEREIEFE